MKIKIYTNDPGKVQDLMSRIYEIVKETTGQEPNIKVTNQSRLK